MRRGGVLPCVALQQLPKRLLSLIRLVQRDLHLRQRRVELQFVGPLLDRLAVDVQGLAQMLGGGLRVAVALGISRCLLVDLAKLQARTRIVRTPLDGALAGVEGLRRIAEALQVIQLKLDEVRVIGPDAPRLPSIGR